MFEIVNDEESAAIVNNAVKIEKVKNDVFDVELIFLEEWLAKPKEIGDGLIIEIEAETIEIDDALEKEKNEKKDDEMIF